jgi:hypothetical protein
MISRLVLLGTIAMVGIHDARAQSVPAASIDFNLGGGAASSRAGDAIVGLGLRHAMGERFMVGVTAGVASFSSQAEFADVEASVKLFSHFALSGKFAYFRMPVAEDHVWFTPLTVGGRLLW